MKVLITGGAGFIGCNTALRFMKREQGVIIYDNLSSIGATENLKWLEKKGDFLFIKGDIRDYNKLKDIFNEDIDVVFHLASQVAVTTSLLNPIEDFEINALGTLNLLEAIKKSASNPLLIYTSTNKVYGEMKDLSLIERSNRYEYRDLSSGVSEDRPLDFFSPYACSKGAADQYVRDYSRIYGLKTVVLRQSSIYGHRQFGREDQGYVAWFAITAIMNRPLVIYGDGKQVRDILFIDDLVDLFELIAFNSETVVGKIYNVGGGVRNKVSLLELISMLELKLNRKVSYSFDKWRPGDQKVYINDISRLKKELNWEPKIDIGQGLDKLIDWIEKNRDYFRGHL